MTPGCFRWSTEVEQWADRARVADRQREIPHSQTDGVFGNSADSWVLCQMCECRVREWERLWPEAVGEAWAVSVCSLHNRPALISPLKRCNTPLTSSYSASDNAADQCPNHSALDKSIICTQHTRTTLEVSVGSQRALFLSAVPLHCSCSPPLMNLSRASRSYCIILFRRND